MKNEEILKSAIEKAVGNGFVKWWIPEDLTAASSFQENGIGYELLSKSFGILLSGDRSSGMVSYLDIIFSHPFAKAFWGDNDIYTEEGEKIQEALKKSGSDVVIKRQKYWEWQLQQMVIEEDPIKYLKQFL